ncbi:MAG: DNA methyltransferase [Spirochaetia bacterium]|nr:DNA methyltransferase [Spirochaetia bacterium]
MSIDFKNIDCMEYMRSVPDQYFDLAIVDPPYGIGKRLSDGGGKLKNTPMARLYKNKDWDVLPTSEYWYHLFRVSKNQIVFGSNYFIEYLHSSRGIICWDKKQDMPTLSSCELVWTSFDKPAKIYRKSSMDLNRIHPTQKPVKLYEWILSNYAKTGDKILDTHGGSMSSAIACYNMGFDLVICELDKDYFDAGKARFENHIKQIRMVV